MGVYLLSGTPGQSKVAATEKMAAFLRDCGATVGVANVEDELLGLFPDCQNDGTSLQEPRVRLVGERPQDEIKDKWPAAFRRAAEKATKGKPDVAIVLLCFEYYRYETYEFYSPVDYGVIKKLHPSSVLTLIDDVFDLYYRLSQRGQVFDIQELVERTYPASSVDRRTKKNLQQLFKDSFGVVVGSLLRLLSWREKEIACAANASRMIGCEHSVLATKHPVETGVRMLLGSTSAEIGNLGFSYPVYVSHPISRPRRDRQNQGEWPPFVSNLDDVVSDLSGVSPGNVHIVPIMPTAIDEFRILDDGCNLHPHLTPRWKLPKAESLFTLPTRAGTKQPFANYEQYEKQGLPLIFDPPLDSAGRRVGLPLSDHEISGMLRNLRECIRLQMAGRDHLLVRQCPGFFLYRPLYGEFEFSGGVASEMHTYDQIRKYSVAVGGKSRRLVAFIHDEMDAIGLFKAKNDETGESFPDPVRQAAAALSSAARDLVAKSKVKTKRPHPPADRTVSEALQVMGNLEEHALVIHSELFPPAKTGSISGGEQPLSQSATRARLVEVVQAERVKALSGDISLTAVYTYSDRKPLHTFSTGTAKPDTHVDVVRGLDTDATARRASVVRTRRFFSKEAN